MNLKISLRVGRILVVLALIVALLGSSIPVPARAVGFVPGLYDIAANIGVNAALRAIGVGPGNSPDAFNQLVTDATSNLFDGLSPLTQVFLDYTANGFRAFLSADFLSRLLGYLFDSGSLFKSQTLPSVPSWVQTRINEAASYPYALLLSRTDKVEFTVVRSLNPLVIDGSKVKTSSGSFQYSTRDSDPWHNVSTALNFFPDVTTISYFGSSSSSVSSDLDVSIDSVSDSLSESAYADWTAGSITQEDQPFVPVSIPSISDSAAIFSQTQAQAQAGTIPEAVVDEIVAGAEVIPDTSTIADVITAVRALGANIVAAVQAIPAAIADIFSPAADPEVYQVDLKDFFPFCIPFDLFDIVTAFAAEPEAPVFEWPISVPRWGFDYTLKVDLQEWEDIASLFRTLELTIFCVGLAIVTREKFLRS